MKGCIGIDPGKAGGIAICYENHISAHKCPETEGDMYSILEIMLSTEDFDDMSANLEHVWGFPSDSGKTAFTFGKNFGAWITCLQIKELDYTLVSPKKWQNHFDTPSLPKKERKRWLKELAQKYVDESDEPFRVTFNTADAILLSLFTKRQV